jgi:hypothetical protein
MEEKMLNSKRRHAIIKEAYRTLEILGIESFPISLFDLKKLLTNKLNIIVGSYSEYARSANLYPGDVANAVGSHDAVTFCKGKDVLMMYNDSCMRPRERQLWSLSHELGHCRLKHFSLLADYQSKGLQCSDEMKKDIELEADFFARNFLAPLEIGLALIGIFPNFRPDRYLIFSFHRFFFGLSGEASYNCALDYAKGKIENYLCTGVIDRFQPYIDKVRACYDGAQINALLSRESIAYDCARKAYYNKLNGKFSLAARPSRVGDVLMNMCH